MGFFTRKTSWSALEFGLMKVCLTSFGIALGIGLYKWLQPFMVWFLIFYLVLGVPLLLIWLGKMRRNAPPL